MGMMRLLSDACALMTRHWEKTQGWQSMLAPEISRWLGGPDPVIDMRANALAAAAISCLDAGADAGPQAAGPPRCRTSWTRRWASCVNRATFPDNASRPRARASPTAVPRARQGPGGEHRQLPCRSGA